MGSFYVTYTGDSSYNLTFGNNYEVIDAGNNRLKIADDSGTHIWVEECYFKEAA